MKSWKLSLIKLLIWTKILALDCRFLIKKYKYLLNKLEVSITLKLNRSFFLFVLIFFFVLLIFIFPAKQTTCRDCGSIENCMNGNGLYSGYNACILFYTQSGIHCKVAGGYCLIY
jgi:hypothetical protein